jgi:hypothetical protein
MADADAGVLRRFRVAGETFEALEPRRVEHRVGLPPLDIGAF